MITLGLVANVDDNGVYVTMPGSKGVLRGPYKALSTVAAGTTVLVASTDDGEQVVVGTADGGEGIYNVRAFGAKGDGVADDTEAIQSALDATPAGAVCYLPPGRYRVTSSLTVNPDTHLRGVGFGWHRDNTSEFGDSDWADPSFLYGSVIVSTVTSGVAVSAVPVGTQNFGLSDFALVGPGTGTSTGLALGSPTATIVESAFRNLLVGNFSLGIDRQLMQECLFEQLMVYGCTVGVQNGLHINNNVHILMDISHCVDGLTSTDQDSNIANLYLGSLFQSNSGVCLYIRGNHNVWDTPYFENPDATTNVIFGANAGNTDGARYCEIRHPAVNGANTDTVPHELETGSAFNRMLDIERPLTIDNAGYCNDFTGNCDGLTDSGSATRTRSDWSLLGTFTSKNPMYFDFLRVADEGTFRFGTDGPRMFSGSGSPEGAVEAVVGSTYHRTDGGAGTSFYVKESGTGNTGWRAV